MSQITNVISTRFQVAGGNVAATMNQYAGGIGRFAGQLNQTTRMSERFNNQWKAIGTTLRYAVAGGAVFNAAQMVPDLRDLQRQVGLISELSGQSADAVIRNQQQVRAGAVEAVTPITEFNEGLINFYSSVSQRPPQNQAVEIMKEISLTAQMAQTQVPEVSKAVTGMLNVFGTTPNIGNIQRYTRMITDLINTVPGGPEAARQIMQQFPTIASPVSQARGTPYQVLGLFQTLLQTGGTPAMHGRGLAYLAQTVGNLGNQTPRTEKAWRSLGITPDVVQRIGVAGAIMTALREIRKEGVEGGGDRLNAQTDEMLDELPSGAQPAEALGLTGRGAELLGALNPRVHAAREMALLLGHYDEVGRSLDSMEADYRGTAGAVKKNRRLVEAFTAPQHIMRGQIALQGLQQQVALGLAPVANFASDQIVRLGRAANENPRRTEQVVTGGAAFLGALGIARFLAAGRWPGVNRIPGVRNVLGAGGQAFVRANAVQAAATAGGILGDAPQNPMYVTVVGQIFGGTPGTPAPTTPGGGTPPIVATAGRAGRLSRFGRLARTGGNVGMLLAGGALLADDPGGIMEKPITDFIPGWRDRHHERRVTARHTGNQRELARAQRMFGRNVTGVDVERRGDIVVAGKAAVELTLNVNRDGKITKRTIAIPMELWSGGRAPTSKAKKPVRTK